ncbi:hypothetical protein [Nonomuraea sp. NPDC050643]|uniref:hypothetical protein n=1 Tax=Nonomuraea sp. NPDC050643 TaxID=3155660 RepID=UPI0033C432AD
MNARLLLAAVPLALALAACGGARAQDDGVVSAGGGTGSATPSATPSVTPSATPSATMDPQEAALKFAQCMREHGVDMPDPQGGRIQLKIPEGMDRKKVDKANEACKPIMESAVRDRGTPDPRDYDQMVKYAQCMREQGVDMPDPKPGEGFSLRLKGDKGRLETARKACERHRPGFAGKPGGTP